MLLTDDDIEFLADGVAIDDFSHDLARRVERVVVAKLCAGVEMPEPASECEIPTETYVVHPGDTVKIASAYTADQLRAYGAACRLKALEDAEQVCATISDKFFKRDGGKWPELRTDAETGAGHCKDAIRALKGEA